MFGTLIYPPLSGAWLLTLSVASISSSVYEGGGLCGGVDWWEGDSELVVKVGKFFSAMTVSGNQIDCLLSRRVRCGRLVVGVVRGCSGREQNSDRGDWRKRVGDWEFRCRQALPWLLMPEDFWPASEGIFGFVEIRRSAC